MTASISEAALLLSVRNSILSTNQDVEGVGHKEGTRGVRKVLKTMR
jgi:hypothetical protein